jgi:Zn-dependent peptidase ImmA (M78 family)
MAAADDVGQSERSRLNLGQGPLMNLLDILEGDVGLRVFILPLQDFQIAGMFYYTDRLGGCILVNGTHPATRQTWSLAHEYAHFLADRNRDDVTVLVEYERKPRQEQFADQFAACFLMPSAGLRQRFRRVVQSHGDFTVADLCGLADQYGVSVEAMTRRLEALNCVRRGMWEQLSGKLDGSRVQAHLGIAGRKAERLRLPERYRRLAVQAYEAEKVTETELARLLRCSRVEARETVQALTETSEVGATGQPYQLDLNFGEILELDAAEKP